MPRSKSNSFEDEVNNLTGMIAAMSEQQRGHGKDPSEWLQTLYQTHATRFLSDNERIWSTGSILIPLSLAGFAAVASVNGPRISHVVALMFASIALMLVWLVIAENHRAFQQKSDAWLVAIERTVGLKGAGPSKTEGNFLNQLLTSKGAIQNMRWSLFVAVVVGWIGVPVMTQLGWF